MKYVQFDAPTEQDLRAFFTVMEEQQGKKMLVHCAANKRVTSFLGLYRVMRQGLERRSGVRADEAGVGAE